MGRFRGRADRNGFLLLVAESNLRLPPTPIDFILLFDLVRLFGLFPCFTFALGFSFALALGFSFALTFGLALALGLAFGVRDNTFGLLF